MKVCVVTSVGGHLYQMIKISNSWADYNHFWVTFNAVDVKSLLHKQQVYHAYAPESRNLVNVIRNFILALKILRVEKPSVVISCGAGIAPPFFLAAKIMGIHTIYIEPIDFIQKPSLTGVLSFPN